MNLGEAKELARVLINTRFLPREIGSEDEIVAIVLMGQELGLGPMSALRSIQVIKGKPCVAANVQLGLMRKQGATFRWTRTDQEVAEIVVTIDGEEKPPFTYTIADAERAGLTGNPTWRKHPQAMLRARCASAVTTMYVGDVLAGIYDPDEGEEIAAATSSSSVAAIVSEGDPQMQIAIDEGNAALEEDKALVKAWDGDLERVEDADGFLQWVWDNGESIDRLDHRAKGPLFTVLKKHGERVDFPMDNRRIAKGEPAGNNFQLFKETVANGAAEARIKREEAAQ